MAGAAPATRNESASRLVNEAILKTYRIGDVDKFLFGRALRELDALQKSDVIDAECTRALLFGIAGRYSDADAALANAERNGGSFMAQEARMKVLLNRMHFTRAASIATVLLQTPGESLSGLIAPALGGGCFRACARAIAESVRAGRVAQATKDFAVAKRAAQALDQARVPDEVVWKMLDELGAIAERDSLLWMNDMPDLCVLLEEEGGPLVRMAFRVAVSPEQACEMNLELIDRLVERNLHPSGVSVGFIGQPVHEEALA